MRALAYTSISCGRSLERLAVWALSANTNDIMDTNDIGKDEIDTITNMREMIQETATECPDTESVL